MKAQMLALAASAILAAAPAAAQEVPPQVDPTADSLSIGTGALVLPSYEGSDDSIVIPEFVLRGQVSRFGFFTRGPTLYVDVVRDQARTDGIDIGFGPVAGIRLDRTTLIKDRQVRALGELDTGIELGGWVGVTKTGVITSPYDLITARVSVVRDVGGAHGSYVVIPTIEYGTPLSTKTFVGVSVLAEYVGKGFGDYYFDVTPAGSAVSGLSAYDGAGSGFKRAGVNFLVVRSLTGDLTRGLSAVGLVGYYEMLGEFKRSPIVSEAGRPRQLLAGLGLTYSF